MDIDDERWGQSWHEVPEITVNDEIEWGNIQQSLRGGGADGMQGVWAQRRKKYDCGDDDEEPHGNYGCRQSLPLPPPPALRRRFQSMVRVERGHG